MEPVEFKKAYYIKLGSGGKYEESSINGNIVRIGYDGLKAEEINSRNWEAIKQKLQTISNYKTKGAAAMDINALRTFVESTTDDVWITFHAGQLWWGQLGEPVVYEDEISRYRVLAGEWHNHDIKHHKLFVNQIPGSIAKIQRFQAVICKVKEVDDLRRLINDQPSQAYRAISQAKDSLAREVQEGVKRLHWKDFEILVDLIFRNAGWRQRTSAVGGPLKYSDIELEAPITGELYQVQVKSQSTVEEFEEYVRQFSHGNFRKLYFVVHSPDKKLAEHQTSGNVELILPAKLAEMVVDFGLTDWLLKKVK